MMILPRCLWTISWRRSDDRDSLGILYQVWRQMAHTLTDQAEDLSGLSASRTLKS